MTQDEQPLALVVARHVAHLKALGYTQATLAVRGWVLGRFAQWASERGVSVAGELAPQVVERYQRYLAQHRKEDGQPLGQRTQRTWLVALRTFGRWLLREGLVEESPVGNLIMPRVGYALPRGWLSAGQAEVVLAQPQLLGRRKVAMLRDRAILETLYSTGLRRLELVRLKVSEVDFAAGAVLVRQGKGRKDRVVPIGERALLWVSKYLEEARERCVRQRVDEGWLFLTERGGPLSVKLLSDLVTRYVTASGVGKVGSCHLFRHTCATVMLENGADIRHVQEQLGHACLQTTQVYTHVSIRKLKEVHAATHPTARLAPRPREEGES